MSNDSSGFPSVDNLTPFEYALAGVEAPDAQDSPSLSVIQQMRRLAAEVENAPISHPALRDLIRTGGIVSRRSDRRSVRRKRPTTAADAAAIVPDEGGFVDITPIELSEDPLDQAFVRAGEESSATTDDSFAALAAGFGPVADVDLDDQTSEMKTSATNGSDLSEQADAGVDANVDSEVSPVVAAAEIDALEVTADGTSAAEVVADVAAVSNTDTQGIAAAPEPPVEPKPAELTRLDNAIVQAQALLAIDENADEDGLEAVEGHEVSGQAALGQAALAADAAAWVDDDPTAEHAAIPDIDELSGAGHATEIDLTDDAEFDFERESTAADHDVSPGHRLSDDDLTVVTSAPDPGSFFVLDDGTELPMVTGADLASASDGQLQDDLPSMFPGVPDDEEFQYVADDGDGLASEAPIGSDDDESDEGAILVGVGAGAATAGILAQGGEVYQPPISADPIAAFNGPAKEERRRVGGAFWALAGTAAAAAVLVLGGLWWASTLRNRTETDTAAAPTTLEDLGEESGGTVGSESPDAEDEVSAGSDVDGTDSAENSESGDFGEQDPNSPSRSSGTDTSVTNTSSNDPEEDPSTTASDSTVAEATTVPETTEAPEVEEEETTTTEEITTTEAPATTVPTPEPTLPPTVAPPTIPALAFIGDSVNLGSFGGPGASGVRVSLYADSNNDGRRDQLVDTQITPRSGRYAFNVEAGCYVVEFGSIPGFDIEPSLSSQAVCVEPGEARARVDAILIEQQAVSLPPDGCYVEDNSNSRQGVEVYENNSDWADSYIFYSNNGSIVYRTPREPHDIDGNADNDYEWTGVAGGFNVRNVWSVAASRGGVVSSAISCFRE